MTVSTVDIIFTDGKITMLDVNATESEAVMAVVALVEEVAKIANVPTSMLLAHCGMQLCPDSCVVINNDDEVKT